jgi:nucleotide-binding universal stress UspA family protein
MEDAMSDHFRTILVPYDLSRRSTRALGMAARLAGARGRVIVLHVANTYADRAVQKRVVDEARRALERLVARTMASRPGPRVECRVERGDPFRKITAAARGADCILMSTAGRTGLRYIVVGSVAEKVVRHAPVPVLTFRPDARRGKELFRTILVPHDFSAHANRALELAASLAGADGRLIVLHVVASLPEGANRIAKQVLADERRRLSRLVARWTAAHGAPAIECRVEAGDPYRHIADAAREADSVVMCTVGRTGLPHLVIGSVAEKVVRHASVPVLTIRPAALAALRSAPMQRQRRSA